MGIANFLDDIDLEKDKKNYLYLEPTDTWYFEIGEKKFRGDIALKRYNFPPEIQIQLNALHDFYCGFLTFPMPNLSAYNINKLEQKMSVHGGITTSRPNPYGSYTIGFDCAHCEDFENEQTRDKQWLKQQVTSMAEQLVKLLEG